jgi:hydrogenase/urease accessory protein HupE
MKKFSLLSFSFLLLPASLLAHPGHGESGGFSIIHYFVEPIHAITTLSIVVAALVYIHWQRRKSKV